MASEKRRLRTAQGVVTALAVVVMMAAAALSLSLVGLAAMCTGDLDPSDCGDWVANAVVPGVGSILVAVAAIVACRTSRRARTAWVSGLALLGLSVAAFPALFFAW